MENTTLREQISVHESSANDRDIEVQGKKREIDEHLEEIAKLKAKLLVIEELKATINLIT